MDATPPLSASSPRLRLWPAVLLVAVQAVLFLTPRLVELDQSFAMYAVMFTPMIVGLGMILWWLFFSRLPSWADRLVGLVLVVGLGVAAAFALHESMSFIGVMYVLPAATTMAALYLLLTTWLDWPLRRIGLLLAVAAVVVFFGLLRSDGVTGEFKPEWAWRWTPTAEEQLEAERSARAAAPTDASKPAAEAVTLRPGDWPGFRGPNRDGRASGVRIDADWKANPPKELWKQRIGPGWSSFAVVGRRVVTQEQRGSAEAVVCLDAETGKELWVHLDETRFTETMAGPGPRSTPTFHDGKFYVLGANGHLNCLDAATGAKVWSRNIAEDAGITDVPIWGYASSPLIVQGIVTVHAGEKEDNARAKEPKKVVAYDAATGNPAWTAPAGTMSYSSTHRATVGGEEQLLFASDQGLTALHPTRGAVLWQHEWAPMEGMARVVQPAVLGDGDFLIGTGFNKGTRRLRVKEPNSTAGPEEVWTSRALSPYFNDLVVHKGHFYGIDGSPVALLSCIGLEDGKRRWRDGRYGSGQLLLLPDQDLILVLSEQGEVVLVEANPEKHVVRGRFKAIEGKTWNHPVVAHGKLFVRNGEWVACYELK